MTGSGGSVLDGNYRPKWVSFRASSTDECSKWYAAGGWTAFAFDLLSGAALIKSGLNVSFDGNRFLGADVDLQIYPSCMAMSFSIPD
jgi:hypothetical protein